MTKFLLCVRHSFTNIYGVYSMYQTLYLLSSSSWPKGGTSQLPKGKLIVMQSGQSDLGSREESLLSLV